MPISLDVLKIIEKAKAERATFIDLGNCGLTELPEKLFGLTGLEGINLGRYYWNGTEWKETANKGRANRLTSESLYPLKRYKIRCKP